MTISAYALTTLADCKTHMNVSSTADDALITELINAATNRIELICRRQFAARNYKERHGNAGNILVRNNPVIRVLRVSVGAANALSLSYSGTAIRAVASVTPTGVYLASWSTSGAQTTNDLAFATYASTDAMATAIGLVSGWTATVAANVPSDDLNPLAGQPCKSSTVYLTYPDVDTDIRVIDYDAGIVEACNAAPSMTDCLVEYRGGYESVSSSATTAELAQLCREFVADAYQSRAINQSIKSESLADYSVALMTAVELTATRRARLANWMNDDVGVS